MKDNWWEVCRCEQYRYSEDTADQDRLTGKNILWKPCLWPYVWQTALCYVLWYYWEISNIQQITQEMADQSNEKSTTKKFLIIASHVWSLKEDKMISHHSIRLSPTCRLHLETTV